MRYILCVVCLLVGMNLQAQVEKYPVLPSLAWDFIIDRAEMMGCREIGSRIGYYVGQVDEKNMLTGFGYYVDHNDNQRIGLFREGRFAFGVTLTQTSALVGTPEHYTGYSLTTAQLEYVAVEQERYAPTEEHAADRFVSITYENGDRYIGETHDGKRHGWGMYYYSNGDFWFGQYRNGIRDGYGCLFSHDHTQWIGRWAGEDTRRLVFVK